VVSWIMKMLRFNPRLALLLLALLAAFVLNGCATTDESDNASARPWNAPKGWETGLPSMMTEGR
jgi:hypothetical protein